MLNDKFQKPHHNRVIGIVLISKNKQLRKKRRKQRWKIEGIDIAITITMNLQKSG